MNWLQYKTLLQALENAGIVEPGYVKASINRKQSFVRPVGVVKIDAPKGVNVLRENAMLRQENYQLRRMLNLNAGQ